MFGLLRNLARQLGTAVIIVTPCPYAVQYRSAVKKDPKLGEARLKLGTAYARTGNAKGALDEADPSYQFFSLLVGPQSG